MIGSPDGQITSSPSQRANVGHSSPKKTERNLQEFRPVLWCLFAPVRAEVEKFYIKYHIPLENLCNAFQCMTCVSDSLFDQHHVKLNYAFNCEAI